MSKRTWNQPAHTMTIETVRGGVDMVIKAPTGETICTLEFDQDFAGAVAGRLMWRAGIKAIRRKARSTIYGVRLRAPASIRIGVQRSRNGRREREIMSTFEDRERAWFEQAFGGFNDFERYPAHHAYNANEYKLQHTQRLWEGWLARAKQAEADRLIAEAAREYIESFRSISSAQDQFKLFNRLKLALGIEDDTVAASQENSKGGGE